MRPPRCWSTALLRLGKLLVRADALRRGRPRGSSTCARVAPRGMAVARQAAMAHSPVGRCWSDIVATSSAPWELLRSRAGPSLAESPGPEGGNSLFHYAACCLTRPQRPRPGPSASTTGPAALYHELAPEPGQGPKLFDSLGNLMLRIAARAVMPWPSLAAAWS